MYTYMEAILYCLHCKEETKHIIIYENKIIKKIKCQKCKIELEINKENIKEKYANEYIEKILIEPQKITDEIQKNLCNFLLSLPIRIMVKPYKLIKEIGENVTLESNILHSKTYHKKLTHKNIQNKK